MKRILGLILLIALFLCPVLVLASGGGGGTGGSGVNAYVYVAYASDASGTGFTTTFDADLDYIAVLSTDTTIPAPAVGDFAGLWKNYKGADGADGSDGSNGEDGSDGAPGASAYVYIAYASADDGTDFTTTFNAELNYVAVKTTTSPIVSPQASDFTGLWKNYKGATGAAGLDGTDGEDGSNGTNGTDGKTWIACSTAPPNDGLGVEGDWSLCTDTGGIYTKGASTWGSPITTLPLGVEKAVLTGPFAGTVSASGTTVTFSSSEEYALLKKGSTLIADGDTRYVLAFPGALQATVNDTTTWAAETAITSIQDPLYSEVNANGDLIHFVAGVSGNNMRYWLNLIGVITAYQYPNGDFVTVGGVSAGSVNIGTTECRDNAGVLECRDSGGVYSAVVSGFQPVDADLTAISAIAGVRGDILYYGPSGWTKLGKGSAGAVLSQGAEDPAWTTTLSLTSIIAPEVNGSAHIDLTNSQVSGTVIYNTGQGAEDVVLQLPTAASGYQFLATVGTAQAGNHWGVQAATNDKIHLVAADGTVAAGSDNAAVVMTAAQVGQSFACWTFKTDAYDWQCKAISIGTSTFAAHAGGF